MVLLAMKRQSFRKIITDSSGAAAVFIAVAMPVFVGGLGMGAEVGYWYFSQRKVQNAADSAAYAAAVSLRAGNSAATMQAAAEDAAADTGHVLARGLVDMDQPPASGGFVGDAEAVEVTVSEDLPRMFTGLFANGPVPVSGRAVARISQGSQTCVLALDESAPGAVTFIGNTDTILVGCSVHSNSLASDSVIVTGSAAVETPCVSAAGEVDADSGLLLTTCTSPYEHADIVEDPYAYLAKPDLTGTGPNGENFSTCKAQNVFGGGSGASYSITGGRYCGGLKVQRTVAMAPGVYVVDGGELDVTSTGVMTGTGVTFFLTNGATIKMNGASTVQIYAPTAGDYAGVLVFVDRNDPYNVHKMNGNNASKFNGAIYSKSGHVEVLGGSTANNGCTQVVARTITFSGNSGIGIDCTGTGVKDIRSSRLVTLVE